jgi:hypothetical protein
MKKHSQARRFRRQGVAWISLSWRLQIFSAPLREDKPGNHRISLKDEEKPKAQIPN